MFFFFFLKKKKKKKKKEGGGGGGGGYAVAQLGEALGYKWERRGFQFQMVSWEFSFDLTFRLHYGPGIDSTSHGNK